MSSEIRTYRKRRRAESEAQTRLRITESAVHLHGTVGPARTSMSAVAEHAGVQRSTLYRHFPDEAALFEACSAHWAAANPPPDLAAWAAIREPDERLRAALTDLYGYYQRTAPMLENLVRDEQVSDVVRERFQAFHAFIAAAADTLLAGRGVRGAARRRTRAAIGHALAFSTWRSLVRDQGLTQTEAVDLACGFVLSPARCTPRRH
jgi:AcrR family transcriptional regulator